METSKRVQILSVLAAVVFVSGAALIGYMKIGLPPVVIVGGSGIIMYTATLPMIPGIYAIYRVVKASKAEQQTPVPLKTQLNNSPT
ncbi:MAG: hypothetical protein ND866_13085 [Pyrinomonadaceae bacterium]|nr:hypothetical protein [Pyrinomonadaceae bacterium]